MKSIKIVATSILFFTTCLFFFSCKKDDVKAQTNAEKIIGKWKFQSIVRNDFYAGIDHIDNFQVYPADYVEFKSDNKAYMFLQGAYDTSAYGIINDNKIWIEDNTDIYDIKSLTSTSFQVYQKTLHNPGEYTENTTTFYR